MILEVYTKTQIARPEEADLEVIVLLCENSNFGFNEKPYYLDVAGLPMHKYLENDTQDFPIVTNKSEKLSMVGCCA